MKFGTRRSVVAVVALSIALLAACSSGSGSPSASGSSSASAGVTTTNVGVSVTPEFGTKPTLTIPATAAPTALSQQVLTQGTGATVAKGDTLVANYVGQTWAPKDGKPNVFDSSFDRGQAAAFVIGVGSVVPGWDKTLVGKKIGSRVLLTLPPADGYGSAGQTDAGITGTDTLVFVVDLVASYSPNASAPGTAVANLPTTGIPKITNIPGKQPTITSTAGVKVPTQPVTTLLVTGSGAKIDSAKTLVLQLVQTDLATGKDTQSTWGQAPQTVAGATVLGLADKLTGQNIGSRAVVVVPATPAQPASSTAAATPASPPEIIIIDVVGQF
ncbi:FKBP-type peptidyl-prolyl cis-trans isomerase [Jatrophihabitans sp. DSM 45814]